MSKTRSGLAHSLCSPAIVDEEKKRVSGAKNRDVPHVVKFMFSYPRAAKSGPSVVVVVVVFVVTLGCCFRRSADTARVAEVISCGFTPHPGGHGEDKVWVWVSACVCVSSNGAPAFAASRDFTGEWRSNCRKTFVACSSTARTAEVPHPTFGFRQTHAGGSPALSNSNQNISGHAGKSMGLIYQE